MNVLPIFGENLHDLCRIAGSSAAVARELGVNRVQFNRFLKSEAFPKPNLLQKICDRFGVDARILTERLTKRELALLETGQSLDPLHPNFTAATEAINFIAPGEAVFDVSAQFPDGLYGFYRLSPSFPDKVMVHVFQIKSLNFCKVIRAYQHRSISERLGDPVLTKQREFRGVLFAQAEGHCIVMMHNEPDSIMTYMFLTPHLGLNSFEGIGFLNRAERPGIARVSRLFMYRLEPGQNSVLSFARQRPLLDVEDVPDHIRDIITSPVA